MQVIYVIWYFSYLLTIKKSDYFRLRLECTCTCRSPIFLRNFSNSAQLFSVTLSTASLGCSGGGSRCEVTITSYQGKYVAAELGGGANANGVGIGSSTRWQIIFLGSNNKVHVRNTDYQKFLVSENDGNVNADHNTGGSFEEFTLQCLGGAQYTFLSSQGKYLVAENTGALNANRDDFGQQEIFTVVPYIISSNTICCTSTGTCSVSIRDNSDR